MNNTILYITEAMGGGVARHIDLALQSLPKHDWSLRLLVSLNRSDAHPEEVEGYREKGIQVDVVSMKRSCRPLADFIALHRIRQHLWRIRPALVHTHSSKGGFLGRRAAASLGYPTIHTPHVFPFEWSTGLRRAVYLLLERCAAHWCERIVCLSDAQREYALQLGVGSVDKLTVVPNGIDFEAFKPANPDEREGARRHFGVPPQAPLVGMVARLEPQKGVGHFLRAAALLRERVPEVRFVLAGQGSLEGKCRARTKELGISNVFSFCGDLRDMSRFYHALDCFVLGSLWEGLPYVILEAQASGIPVVSSRTFGAEAIIEHEETGLLAPLSDEEALAEAMQQVLQNEQLSRHLSLWGRTRVEERFGLARWADEMDRVYRAVIDKK